MYNLNIKINISIMCSLLSFFPFLFPLFFHTGIENMMKNKLYFKHYEKIFRQLNHLFNILSHHKLMQIMYHDVKFVNIKKNSCKGTKQHFDCSNHRNIAENLNISVCVTGSSARKKFRTFRSHS